MSGENQIVIEVQGLGKRYRVGERVRYLALRDLLARVIKAPFGFAKTSEPDYLWALRDVCLEIRQGEVVGLIGRNGAGKSTLLKVLARITRPTIGWAEVRGRIGSLLEVGTGFHPELTGRENVYLSGAILGMQKTEIERKFDEIVAFAEVERFLDTPLKHYSSGMQMRLAFAVAAHLEPEILLVDEVLAVGDAAFQKRCLGKMGEVARDGRTIIFVSHNLRAITDLCRRCVWIDGGRMIEEGNPEKIILAYLGSGFERNTDGAISGEMHLNATGDVYFRRISLMNQRGESAHNLFCGEPLRIEMEYEVCRPIEAMRLIVAVEKLDGTLVSVSHHTDDSGKPLIDARPGEYSATAVIELPLMPGAYTLHLGAKPAPGYWGVGPTWDWVPRALDFYVEEFTSEATGVLPAGGLVRPRSRWDVEKKVCQ